MTCHNHDSSVRSSLRARLGLSSLPYHGAPHDGWVMRRCDDQSLVFVGVSPAATAFLGLAPNQYWMITDVRCYPTEKTFCAQVINSSTRAFEELYGFWPQPGGGYAPFSSCAPCEIARPSESSVPFCAHCIGIDGNTSVNNQYVWDEIKAVTSDVTNTPATVTLTYSYMQPGVSTGENGAETSVEIKDHNDGSVSHAGFLQDIVAALDEWKEAFETVCPWLTLNFTPVPDNGNGLGEETGTNVGSYASAPTYLLPHSENIGDIRFGMHPNITPAVPTALAHAYSPGSLSYGSAAGDCHFDSADDWRLDSTPPINDSQSYSIKYVATHELGHTLGWGHHPEFCNIMYASADTDGVFADLFPDGLKGHAPTIECIKCQYAVAPLLGGDDSSSSSSSSSSVSSSPTQPTGTKSSSSSSSTSSSPTQPTGTKSSSSSSSTSSSAQSSFKPRISSGPCMQPPLIANSATAGTVFLLQGESSGVMRNSSFFDLSPYNHPITRRGGVRHHSWSVYTNTGMANPGGSIYFPSLSANPPDPWETNHLSVPNHKAFAFGAGDFTIELWFFVTNFRSNPPLSSLRGQPPQYVSGLIGFKTSPPPWDRALWYEGWALGYTDLGHLQFDAKDAGVKSKPGLIKTYRWHHAVVTRASNCLKMLFDGAVVGCMKDTIDYTHTSDSAGDPFKLVIGEYYVDDVGYTHNGAFIQDVRITSGTAFYPECKCSCSPSPSSWAPLNPIQKQTVSSSSCLLDTGCGTPLGPWGLSTSYVCNNVVNTQLSLPSSSCILDAGCGLPLSIWGAGLSYLCNNVVNVTVTLSSLFSSSSSSSSTSPSSAQPTGTKSSSSSSSASPSPTQPTGTKSSSSSSSTSPSPAQPTSAKASCCSGQADWALGTNYSPGKVVKHKVVVVIQPGGTP